MQSDWQPSCSIELLRLRAQLLAEIRGFFSARAVLEVETPLLSYSSGTDPQLDFFTSDYCSYPLQQTLYLQTSPEFAMKRLLAAGSGSIYQICKAFRNGESGRTHNPEFTIIEWYSVDFTLTQLMDEIADLIAVLFKDRYQLETTQRISYQEVFYKNTGLDPLLFNYEQYSAYALKSESPEAIELCKADHNAWLDFIFSHHIQPSMGKNALCMVYGYPACQSSLARINKDNSKVTDRVEIFINGIELGNGYYELTDAQEQNQRFDKEIELRQQSNRPIIVKNTQLIAALEAGLPECSGMAIGIDRLLMVLTKNNHIEDVIPFSLARS
ncbi:MAG: EF-P lysine aminoacylase GenX [Methylococcales bacterium]|nr:MAG: EF-P lysine aminoacylase GenX [Methylococcales bacterium]